MPSSVTAQERSHIASQVAGVGKVWKKKNIIPKEVSEALQAGPGDLLVEEGPLLR